MHGAVQHECVNKVTTGHRFQRQGLRADCRPSQIDHATTQSSRTIPSRRGLRYVGVRHRRKITPHGSSIMLQSQTEAFLKDIAKIEAGPRHLQDAGTPLTLGQDSWLPHGSACAARSICWSRASISPVTWLHGGMAAANGHQLPQRLPHVRFA